MHKGGMDLKTATHSTLVELGSQMQKVSPALMFAENTCLDRSQVNET